MARAGGGRAASSGGHLPLGCSRSTSDAGEGDAVLLMVTVGLVLAGVVLLVVGFADNSLGYIYAAIVCAAVAGAALIAFSRLSHRRALRLAAAGGGWGDEAAGSPLPERGRRGPDSTDAVSGAGRRAEPVTVVEEGAPRADPDEVALEDEAAFEDDDEFFGGGDVDTQEVDLPLPPPAPGPSLAPAPAPAASSTAPESPAAGGAGDELEGWDEDWDDDQPLFPIEDYDDLRVSEIVPLIGELDADELLEVRDRELATKSRATVLRRIAAALADLGVPAPPAPAPPATPSPAPPSAAAPGPPGAAARRGNGPAAAGGAPRPEPIPGYASMRASDILPLLASLDPAVLAAVADAERAGANRATVLSRIARLQAAGAPRSSARARRP